MPKSPLKLAAEIQAKMQSQGKQVLTMPWPEFYQAADISRFRQERGDEIAESCKALGIIAGYGNFVVSFCNDANFAAG